jgi:hypothetical protein
MLKNTDVARFVVALLPNALKSDHVHRTLLAFNAASLHDFILRSKSLDEGTVAFLLPALLEPLQKRPSGADAPRDSIVNLTHLFYICHTENVVWISLEAMSSCLPSLKNVVLRPKLCESSSAQWQVVPTTSQRSSLSRLLCLFASLKMNQMTSLMQQSNLFFASRTFCLLWMMVEYVTDRVYKEH